MSTSSILSRTGRVVYWTLPLVLFAVQAAWVVRSDSLLRYEEVAESVRGPYWLAHGSVFDGISTNVSWYALLAAIYPVVGFGLTTARWVKALLALVSLLALARLLEREMARPFAAALLVAIGLSPAWLFFTTVATSFGVDLLAVPVVLWLFAATPSGPLPQRRALLADAVAWAVAMAAAMAYPVFLFYLPGLAWIYWRRLGVPGLAAVPRTRLAVAVGGLLAPLVAAFALLPDRQLLLHDPATRSGIFRGGGGAFTLDWKPVATHVERVYGDLFVRGQSYYCWIPRPDLSDWLAQGALVAALLAGLWLLVRRPGVRAYLALLVALPVVNLVLTGLAGGPPGLRRATIVLAAVYGLVFLAAREAAAMQRPLARGAALSVLLLIPLHHLAAAPRNFQLLPRGGARQNLIWLAAEPTPARSLERWLTHTEDAKPLDCREVGPARGGACQLSSVFALLQGWREWNGQPPVPLVARDPRSGDLVVLSTTVWRERDLPP